MGDLATQEDRAELEQCEATIREGLQTFVDVGRALARIRDDKLFREAGFKTFETYCSERWEFKKRRAYQLIEAAGITENVHNCAREVPLPSNEGQVRELARLPEPTQQAEAWKEAVETAPEGKVTAKHVASVVAKRLPPPEQKQSKAPAQTDPTTEESSDVAGEAAEAPATKQATASEAHAGDGEQAEQAPLFQGEETQTKPAADPASQFRGDAEVDQDTGEVMCSDCGAIKCCCDPTKPTAKTGPEPPTETNVDRALASVAALTAQERIEFFERVEAFLPSGSVEGGQL